MSQPLSGHDGEVWRRFVGAYTEFAVAQRELYSKDVDRVALVRENLRTGKDLFPAIDVLRHLTTPELQSLFDRLVAWASWGHGTVQVFRDAILSLPKNWVLERIEAEAEPLLSDGTYDEYRRLLELYIQLDRDLTLSLARRAAAHADEDIREAGEDFLEKLGEADGPGPRPNGGAPAVTDAS